MCLPALPAVILGSAVLGAGVAARNASLAAKAQKSSQQQAETQAKAQAQTAEQQFNRQNQKQPSITALFNSNRRGASSGSGRGVGSTFLTGSSGVRNMPLGGAPSLLGS